MQLKAAAHDRFAQIEFEGPPRLGLGVHPGLEELIISAPIRLGGVKGEIGILQEPIGLISVIGSHRDPDARIRDHMVPAEVQGLPHSLLYPRDQVHDVCCLLDASLYDRKFIPAQSCNKVGIAHTAPQSAGNRYQQLIADWMTERIVDGLEVIEIEIENRKLRATMNPA